MRHHIARRTQPQQHEQQSARDHAAPEPDRALLVASERERMRRQQTQRRHDESRRAQTTERGFMQQQRRDIPQRAAEQRQQQRPARAVTAHREAEEDKPDGHVRQQVRDIRVQRDGGEDAPPFSVQHRTPIHRTGQMKILLQNLSGKVEQDQRDKPDRRPHIEEQSGPLHFTPPRFPVLTFVERERFRGAREVRLGYFQKPRAVLFTPRDDILNALTDEHEAPVQRLHLRAAFDDGEISVRVH